MPLHSTRIGSPCTAVCNGSRIATTGGNHATGQVRQATFALIMLFAGLLALVLPGRAMAGGACHYTKGTVPATVTFTGPSTLTTTASTPVGTVLWTSAPTAPSPGQPHLNCSGFVNNNGINNLAGPNPASGNTFATNINGIGYRILNGDTGLPIDVYPQDTIKSHDILAPSTMILELVKTGSTVGTGALALTLGTWDFNANPGMLNVETFTLGSSISVAPASCTVSSQSQTLTVSLPTLSVGSFTAVGSTGGTTLFSISLNCQAGAAVKVTMDTSNPDTHTGVIAPSGAGYAAGIGVRVLDGNAQPITFGSQQTVTGSVSAGAYSIPYRVQYFQTSSPAGFGPVHGALTFTMAYQ